VNEHSPPWLGVELRHLAALTAVQREGSFRGAAESLGYVQSAVSQQIARLEHLVGARLIERSRGTAPVALTREGELLLGHADQIMSHFTAAQADLNALSNGLSSTLRVGVFQSVATRILPTMLRDVAERLPGLRIVPREAATDSELFDLVERGDLDAAFADVPLEPGPFGSCELMADPFVLLMHAGSLQAANGWQPTMAKIAALPLIRQPSCRMSTLIELELRATGVEPDFVVSSDTNATIQALVAAGVGAAILPRLAAEPPHPGTVAIALDALLPPARLAFMWHRERRDTPALQAFRKIAQTVCANLDERAHLARQLETVPA